MSDLSASLFRDLCDDSGLAALAIDPESRRILTANQAFARLSGFTADELAQRMPQDLYDDRHAAVAGEDPSAAEIVLLRRRDGSSREVRVFTTIVGGDASAVRFDILFDVTAEADSRRTADLFLAMVDSALDHIVTADLRGYVTYANPAIASELGYDRSELAGMYLGSFLPEGQYDDLQDAIRGLAATGGSYRGEVIVRRRDGSTYPTDLTASLIWDKAGRPCAFLLIGRNVTDQRQAERALLESEERYRTLAETAQDPIFIVDGDLVLRYVNQAGARLWNTQPAEVVGRPFLDVVGGMTNQQTGSSIIKLVFSWFW
jgi:PAS domain S-box-containing protein